MSSNTNVESTHITAHTKNWVSHFIIAHNICPFAKRAMEDDSIHYEISSSTKMEDQLQTLILACTQMDNHSEIETTLVIYPAGLELFDDYLDFLEIANALLTKQNYEGVYQLASFHPDYCFDGVEEDDASNYTNRSPYPMLHLIREDSLEKALLHFPNPEEIPERNIEYTRNMGSIELRKILSDTKNP